MCSIDGLVSADLETAVNATIIFSIVHFPPLPLFSVHTYACSIQLSCASQRVEKRECILINNRQSGSDSGRRWALSAPAETNLGLKKTAWKGS